MLEQRPRSWRTTPRGAMGALVLCACGHGIGAHSSTGCRAGGYAACSCRRTDGEALNLAIALASDPPKPRQSA